MTKLMLSVLMVAVADPAFAGEGPACQPDAWGAISRALTVNNTYRSPFMSSVSRAVTLRNLARVGPNQFISRAVTVDNAYCEEDRDCADRTCTTPNCPSDGIRDDGCVRWACEQGTCIATDIHYADYGGNQGACLVDGTADGNDFFHALNCFSNVNTLGAFGYPCEASPPFAIGVDAAGLQAPCTPDGVCDGNDAFAAINAFSATTTCSCPPDGPQPMAPAGKYGLAQDASVALSPARSRARRGGLVEVDVVLTSPLADLRGYQLHVGVSGGQSGQLFLRDLAVHPKRGGPFDGLGAWQAFNVESEQMLVGVNALGVATTDDAYLATLIFEASRDARGRFVVDLRADPTKASDRTVLFPTSEADRIQIKKVNPAIVEIR